MKCKLKPQAKKSDIIATLLSTAASQSILSFAPEVGGKSKGKAKDNGIRQTVLPFSSCKRPVNQSQRLKQMAMKLLGKCIRVNKDILRLVKRLHIIGYRVTEHPTALLLPELLSRFKKRSYTKVDHTRSNNIWTSREEVLAYEKALHLETLLDEVIEGPKDKDKVPQTRNQSRPPAKEPITSAGGKHLQTPLKMPATISNLRTPISPAVKGEDDLDQKVFNPPEDDLHDADIDVKKEVQVKRHIDKWLYSMCKESVTRYTSMGRVIAPGLERFCDAYVLFRMLGKAVRVLGSLKEYQQELEILEFMLSQRTWRRGKRGEWYRRIAVIYVHLIRRADTKEKRFDLQKAYLLLLRNAVLDNEVGIVFLPDLINRLMKLEKTLKLPVEQQTTCEGVLLKPKTIEINARKISTPLRFDSLGRLIEEKENTPDLLAYMIPTKAFPKLEEPVLKKNTGKSCWQGKDGIVNVETIVLEHYEALGFTGFHSETRLLTTIFALLFWDIIFAKVPGAFETPFQFAPLDMFEDTFYHARKDLIDARLKEIQEGDAGWQKILQRHDDAYREKRTWCIGIHWDLCSKEELFDIFKCIGKDSLAFICKLFCQDYRGRQSGGPDLFVWKAQEGLCKFVEVKGPGDRPSEGQKYWFDSLRRANVEVEICRVVDECAKTEPPVTATKKRKSRTPGANPRRRSMPFGPASDDVDYDALDPEDSPAPDSNHGPSTRKRRRVSEPQTIYKAEHP
ncbi:hypothetical protein CVT26_004891 [Gymnopilus dilepis]|uniref:Fanconi-associated nuclease n=1 Tax=Gymnopilus dilepis TaxID=231916 RepID=A0A409W8J6_9AGAR|nr:hypothetical protein CVT26_004891 [Gymnopilus dilepis]